MAETITMHIIKRSGEEVEFDSQKIENAIRKASESVPQNEQLNEEEISEITRKTVWQCKRLKHIPSVEDVQDIVENELMIHKHYAVARHYITYRYERALVRKSNTTDEQILSLIESNNEEVMQENANKNPKIASTQRDYMAGEVSKDVSRRLLLPKHIVEAHDAGIIHFHDMDYFSNHIHNCDLINLEDMLQNGTVISGTKIEKPHSFSTACNVATQIVAQVASSQYGGQSISLSHLAPFVDVSRQYYRREVHRELEEAGIDFADNVVKKIAEDRVRKEITKGIQMIQYQVITLMTTNGQAPFITVFMYLNEVEDGQTKDDLALMIEETLKQRTQGVKNEKGIWITPAFPKLIYVLEEDNIHEDSKYWYLTELAAKCTARRMVPDYISEKIMKQLKVDAKGEGRCYPCMGCVDGDEVVTYKLCGMLHVENFELMWNTLSHLFKIHKQPNGKDEYIDLKNVEIHDREKGFVKCHRIIRNYSDDWMRIVTTSGRVITCTNDHPFVTDRGRVLAQSLILGDALALQNEQYSENHIEISEDLAWAYGVSLNSADLDCKNIRLSFPMRYEDEIIRKLGKVFLREFSTPFTFSITHRGLAGDFKELTLRDSSNLKLRMISMYKSFDVNGRYITNEAFTWDTPSKIAFLAGFVDGSEESFVHTETGFVEYKTTNKKLALQLLSFTQALNLNPGIYIQPSEIGRKDTYIVEFDTNASLMEKIQTKTRLLVDNKSRKDACTRDHVLGTVKEIKSLNLHQYSYDVTTESDHFDVSGIYSHNCRSFLTPYLDENSQPKYYGRFNQGVVTLNLVDVALSSGKVDEKLWKILDERLALCKEALMCRHNRLKGTKSDIAPILWQNGALARLEKGETIDRLLYNGYSTISLGYGGLYEMAYYMTGRPLTDEVATEFALRVMKSLNDACEKWKKEENIDFSLYGSPMESTVYKFAKCLQKRFGVIEHVTDKNYITNSYHVHVTQEIDAFSKLTFESQFQKLSPGGAISYVEVPNMENNIDAVLAVIKHIYETIMYAELNTKSDYCQCCGYSGEIMIVEDESGKLVWECPNCKNRDQDKMNVARRTCGYIGTQFWNQGRTLEIKQRVLHL